MDEAREEREELAALEREAADEAREQEAARIYWLDFYAETARNVDT